MSFATRALRLPSLPTGICVLALAFAFALGLTPEALAQSGKIAGRVTERGTGDPLPGVNVAIDGTTQGTSTDMNGYYSILNVSPGVYDLRASFVGFASQVVTDVNVDISLTTTIDFQLSEEVFEGEEVVVVANRPIVQVDVAASTANISQEQIESLPVASVTGAIGLQAGIQGGLSVRGSGSDEVLLNVNGLSLRDERNNTPFTGLSLLSVQEIQVQTGGFSAKYGNLRSGLINIVTKEGQRDRYEASVLLRYSPARQKNFGSSASDPNSFWLRPYLDPEVAFTGTENGAWDQYTQRQYQQFDGWIAVSEARLADDDPTNDMTPAALQDAFRWQHSKVMEIQAPDYSLDFGFGGPVPLLSRYGGTRFYATHRRTQDAYFIPQSRDRYGTHSTYAKVTSNLSSSVKLSLEGLYGLQTGISNDRGGQPGIFTSAGSQTSQLSRVSFIDTRIYATDYWAPTEVSSFLLGGKVTYTPDAKSFLEVRFSRFASDYDTAPGRLRDTTAAQVIGGVAFDELPFGFLPDVSTNGVDGMRASVGMSNARDTSKVVVYNVRADYTRQISRFLEVETGGEFAYVNSHVRYGQFDAVLPTSNTFSTWNEAPLRGALYGQGKLEFQGMIANLGLRLDYFNANTDWYDYDTYVPAFAAGNPGFDTLATSPTKNIVTLSPRLAVAFPITESSKLFFNYGHFRQQPDPDNLYLLRRFLQTQQVTRVASPNNPFPKTVSYEIGYDQSFFDEFLVRISGYYKDASLQPFQVSYRSRDSQTEYTRSEPDSYADTRGFEATLERNQGKWVQGFINYTYRVTQTGYFGSRFNFENSTDQAEFERDDAERRRALSRPLPIPFARLNLNVLVPEEVGPSAGGLYPLGGWMISFLGTWSDGGRASWANGFSVPAAAIRNIDVQDNWNLNLRFAKDFSVGQTTAELFIDVYNVLNRKDLSSNGFFDGADQLAYYESLHFPESEFYDNIVGDDKVGVFRDEDIAFQPMERLFSEANPPADVNERAFYYATDTERWVVWNGDAFVDADMDAVQQALDDKAYIDMPNQGFLTFLNPRDLYVGVRFNF